MTPTSHLESLCRLETETRVLAESHPVGHHVRERLTQDANALRAAINALSALKHSPTAPEPPATDLEHTSPATLHRNSWRHGWADGYRSGVSATLAAPDGVSI